MYKPSMFNFVLDDKEEVILYNTMSGLSATCRVSKANVSRVKEILLNSNTLIEANESDPIITGLIQNGFLVSSDLDEKQNREALFTEVNSGGMLRLIVLPTEQCNFRCKYCYESFKKGKMEPETQESISRFIQKNSQRFAGVMLSWFGGEPLLAMDIIETMSRRIMEICKKAKRKYVSDITTNGYLLSLDVFRKLLDLNVIEYQITVDGTKEIHDAKKPLINGNGTFDTVTNNIREIKKNVRSSTFSIIIRSNVTADALEDMDSFTDFFYEMLGEDKRFTFFLRPAGDWGGENRLNEMVQKRISSNDISCVYMNFYNAGHPLKIDTHRSFYYPGGCMCYASFLNSYVIDSVGDLRKCTCELDDDEYCIGKLKPNGEMDIDPNKHIKWIGNTTRFSDKCNSCKFSPACFGACCPKRDIFEKTEVSGDSHIICPSEKEQILHTLKFIDNAALYPFIDSNLQEEKV
mgnify:CR=1 FL=1